MGISDDVIGDVIGRVIGVIKCKVDQVCHFTFYSPYRQIVLQVLDLSTSTAYGIT